MVSRRVVWSIVMFLNQLESVLVALATGMDVLSMCMSQHVYMFVCVCMCVCRGVASVAAALCFSQRLRCIRISKQHRVSECSIESCMVELSAPAPCQITLLHAENSLICMYLHT
jgi:hypothetical protein